MTQTIGIIGNGRFGDLLYKTFTKAPTHYDVKIYSSREKPDGRKFFELAEVCACDILIPTVPISAFEDIIQKIKGSVSSETLLVDVCSVKTHSVKVMTTLLPDTVDILATHPMFGPDSTKDATTFGGLKFIYAKVRAHHEAKIESFLNFWRDLGCELIELSPDEHDMQAAYTHAFAFLVGKIGVKMGVRKNHINTKGFEGLLYNQTAVENDTSQLFRDMMLYNPYTSQMRRDFHRAFNEIESELNF